MKKIPLCDLHVGDAVKSGAHLIYDAEAVQGAADSSEEGSSATIMIVVGWESPGEGAGALRLWRRERGAAKGLRRVALSELAFEALAGEGGKGSTHVPARLARAIRCYLGDRGSGNAGWPYPSFVRDRAVGEGVELELSIDDDLWRSLEDEAGRQSVSAQQMIEHAALYTAAEMNAGRFTERILDGLEDDDS